MFNIYGVRPAVWFGYVTGALLCIPAFVLMFLPYVTGDWSSSNIDFKIGANGGLALALVWLYFMCWSSYGIEVVATFAPEYHDSQRDTRMALRMAALFSALVYVLLPLGAGGMLGTEAIAADAHADRVVHAGVRRDRRQLPRRRDDLLRRRGPGAVDEHGHDGRLAGAVRDREGRHDDPPVRRAQQATACPRSR